MPQWKQQGFVVISAGTALGPMVHGFRHTRWEAEAEMRAVEAIRQEAQGRPLEAALADLRIVPAELSFPD